MTLSSFKKALLVLCTVLLVACGSKTELFSGLNEAEANDVLSALLQAGIPAEKRIKKDGVSVDVSTDGVNRALTILKAMGLPRKQQDGIGQVFKKDGLISSPLEEKARLLYALSQEIEKTLLSIDGVITSRVHIVLPDRVNPGEPLTPSSAAVFIKHHPDMNFAAAIPRIRQLVFNSIPGLSGDEREKVTVVAMPAQLAAVPSVEWVYVGPFQVLSTSAELLNRTFALIAFLWALSLAGLYFFHRFIRKRALSKAQDSSAPNVKRTAAGDGIPKLAVLKKGMEE